MVNLESFLLSQSFSLHLCKTCVSIYVYIYACYMNTHIYTLYIHSAFIYVNVHMYIFM